MGNKDLDQVFKAQQAAFQKNPLPKTQERIAALKRLKVSIIQNRRIIADMIDKDFGGRSKDESYLAEVVGSLEAVNFSIKRIKKSVSVSDLSERC